MVGKATLAASKGAFPQAIGPFLGGLNNVTEESTIADNQVTQLVNFDIDPQGTLVSRPPIVAEHAGPSGTSAITPLGYYIRADGETFLVATAAAKTWVYQLSTQVWTSIWSGVAADFAQYDNKIVMISETQSGGYWEAGTFTASTTMPLGSQIVVYNERFWAFGPRGTATATTVFFSNLTVISPSQSIYNWSTTTDFFVVDKGDGQYITAMMVDPNALLIFRNRSTYQFSYPSSPSTGTLTRLSQTIGADNAWSVARYENYYMVLNQGFLYQFISYQFYSRNVRIVRFQRSTIAARVTADIRLSIFGERALVWWYGSVYTYNLKQGAWAEWQSTVAPAWVLTVPGAPSDTPTALVVTGDATQTAKNQLYRITEGVLTSGAGETMTCTVRTKAYTFGAPGDYKRLLYWALGYRSASGVSGQVVPLGVTGATTTFDDMATKTFDDLAKGSWDVPVLIRPTIIDDVAFPAAAAVQAYAKVKAALRFLSAYFQIVLHTTGTTATAPVRVFTVTAYLKQHARTGQKVS